MFGQSVPFQFNIMLCFCLGVNILNHNYSPSYAHTYLLKHICSGMITSINWEQAEVEVNREHHNHSTILRKQEKTLSSKQSFQWSEMKEKR